MISDLCRKYAGFRIDRSARNGITVNEEMIGVKEICRIAGVTRKTLFYYDRIGLLEPSHRAGKQNFKEYDDAAVRRLIEIRLYREMGLSIPMIQKILEADETDQNRYLKDISDIIRADIRKRTEDAQIIDVLRRLSRQEFSDVIAGASGLDDLRECLLEQNRQMTGGGRK